MVVKKTDMMSQQYSDMDNKSKTNNSDFSKIIVLLQQAADVCYELGMLMQHEKNVYHSRGFHGFKRCCRYASRQYFERAMNLESIIIDNFGGLPMSEAVYESLGYNGTCMEHMQMIYDFLIDAEREMNDIIVALVVEKEYFAVDKVKCCLCSIQKEIKYMKRHLNFMKDIKGDISQLHWYSNVLHDEMKKLEESKHNRYY